MKTHLQVGGSHDIERGSKHIRGYRGVRMVASQPDVEDKP